MIIHVFTRVREMMRASETSGQEHPDKDDPDDSLHCHCLHDVMTSRKMRETVTDRRKGFRTIGYIEDRGILDPP